MAANLEIHPNVVEHFHDYPLERLWYLLFDYNRRFLGPAGFDKPCSAALQKTGEQGEDEHETGYLSAMFSGLNYVLATIDTPLSLDYLRNLHDKAISKEIKDRQPDIKAYRDGTIPIITSLSVTGLRRSATFAGFKELRERIRKGDNYFRIVSMKEYERSYHSISWHQLALRDKNDRKKYSEEELREFREYGDSIEKFLEELKKSNVSDEEFYEAISNLQDVVVMRFVCTKPEILKRLENIIAAFNTQIATAGISEDAKIRAIAVCIQDILLTHPFSDGNGRTVSLLLNKLLLQYNLSPTILDNPTIIDAFSVDELCAAIKKGQDVFHAQKICPRPRAVDSIFREAEERLSADPVVPQTEEGVMHLKNNHYVAALLVHAATDTISIWNETNIGDRQRAVNLFIQDLCANSPVLNAEQIEQKKEGINDKVTMVIYKRGTLQFFSSGNMFSKVARSLTHGNFGEATHMVFDGNQYGIDFTRLENSGHTQNTPSPSRPSHRG